jgi:hypothetical protein
MGIYGKRGDVCLKMKGILAVLLCLLLLGCAGQGGDGGYVDTTAWLSMNTEFPMADSLPDGQGQTVKVILLLGQSNATGCSLTSYLQKGVTAEEYEAFAQGYDTVRIHFSMDDQKYSFQGVFVPVDLNCGAGEGYFGPELGMAEMLAGAYPEETVVILKYTMSGYSLHHHWLCAGGRGSIYEACMAFVQSSMDYLESKHYDPRIGAICWMQGESDTTDFKASHYLKNQTAFASYLREDLAAWAEDGGIYFIDAGISSSPYCLPAYPAINEAKAEFAKLSPLNLYFSTIDAGFTTLYEPVENPDLGHYDALSELELGRIFGRLIIESYEMRN